MINYLKQIIKRYKEPIDFNNLNDVKPVSSVFGLDRGTPIDRYYIEKFLSNNKKHIKGNILEISETTYSKKYSDNLSNNKYNILTYDKNQLGDNVIIGDLTNIDTLPKNEIDCFICTQTLNFIYDIKKAIEGAYNMLSDKGVLVATVAGLTQISRYDMERWGDYWRFTDLSIRKLLEEKFASENIKIEIFGNVLAANALLQGIAVEDLDDKSNLEYLDNNYQIIIGIVAKK